MFIDIVIPKGNEEKFIEQAKKLGCNGLIFLYEKEDKNNLVKVKQLEEKNFKIYTALLVKENISKKKHNLIFSNGSRSNFENKNMDLIFNLEKQTSKDHLHFRNSGLNHILCGLAREKEIIIGFNFNLVLSANNKWSIIGKMMQNANLCSKYKVKMLIASFAKKPSELKFYKDLEAFGVVLGLNKKQAKDAVINIKFK